MNLPKLCPFLSKSLYRQDKSEFLQQLKKPGYFLPILKPVSVFSRTFMEKFGRKVKDLIRGMDSQESGENLKVGHAGTLDPLASGVLIVAVGQSATKQIPNIHKDFIKHYEFIIRLGQCTSTFDSEAEVFSFGPMESEVADKIRSLSSEWKGQGVHRVSDVIAKKFTGHIEQIIPPFSAKKINGRRMYEFSRNLFAPNQSDIKNYVEFKKFIHDHCPQKKVHVHEFSFQKVVISEDIKQISEYQPPSTSPYPFIDLHCEASVGTGTYIRSLGFEVGEFLNVGGHCVSIFRSKVGDIKASDCWQYDEFTKILDQHKI